jgi:hypothetical protein
MSIENLKTFDPFAEADEDTGQVKQSQQDYIHIRIQRTSLSLCTPLKQCCALVPQLRRLHHMQNPSPRRTATRALHAHRTHEQPLTSHRAQWPQDPNNGSRTAKEIRPEEDPQGDQEEVCLQWHHSHGR